MLFYLRAPQVFALKTLAVIALSCFAAGSLLAMAPQLSGTSPIGGQRGTEVEVAFNGERLADAKELIWYGAGIQVVKMEVPTNQAAVIKATLKIAPDCRLGEHIMRVR